MYADNVGEYVVEIPFGEHAMILLTLSESAALAKAKIEHSKGCLAPF